MIGNISYVDGMGSFFITPFITDRLGAHQMYRFITAGLRRLHHHSGFGPGNVPVFGGGVKSDHGMFTLPNTRLNVYP